MEVAEALATARKSILRNSDESFGASDKTLMETRLNPLEISSARVTLSGGGSASPSGTKNPPYDENAGPKASVSERVLCYCVALVELL